MKKSSIGQMLDGLNGRGMKFGTSETRKILDGLGCPDESLKIIHVAGTNGKGSTAAYIGNIISNHGKRTGVFLSPAVCDIEEQYLIDGRYAEDKDIQESILTVLSTEAGREATRFEVETAAAIYLFVRKKCEYAVLECGMGGLTDATNAVNKKEIAVITSISLEHTKFLGDTLQKICEQKAGIIKDCPVVVSNLQLPEVRAYFEKLGAVFADGECGYVLGMRGAAQPYNAALAVKTADMLGFNDFKAISSALKTTVLTGRFQPVYKSENCEIILDGAHNPASITALCENIKHMNPTVIYGCLSDKDIDGCVSHIAKTAKRLIAVPTKGARAMDKEKIYSVCKRYFKDAERAESVTDALKTAADFGGVIVVCGSFTLLKEAKQWIEKRS